MQKLFLLIFLAIPVVAHSGDFVDPMDNEFRREFYDVDYSLFGEKFDFSVSGCGRDFGVFAILPNESFNRDEFRKIIWTYLPRSEYSDLYHEFGPPNSPPENLIVLPPGTERFLVPVLSRYPGIDKISPRAGDCGGTESVLAIVNRNLIFDGGRVDLNKVLSISGMSTIEYFSRSFQGNPGHQYLFDIVAQVTHPVPPYPVTIAYEVIVPSWLSRGNGVTWDKFELVFSFSELGSIENGEVAVVIWVENLLTSSKIADSDATPDDAPAREFFTQRLSRTDEGLVALKVANFISKKYVGKCRVTFEGLSVSTIRSLGC